MKEEKITIRLPNGDSLVAETCPYGGGQIAVGLIRDGTWFQDLAVIETANEDGEYIKDKFNVYVYTNEYDEGYTECFHINRVPDSAL